MPRITAIEEQAHDAERVNVYLDGEFAFGASRLLIMSRRLVRGDEISQQEADALRKDDDVERAFNAALNFLSYRPRSRREIETYFRKRNAEPEIVERVIERLVRNRLVDDREFARFWVENRQNFRPRGTRALRMEMRQKGLEGEVIDEALENLGDEAETAVTAGERKAKSLGKLDEREFFRKMVPYLQRRGFPYDAAARASRRLFTQTHGHEADEDLLNE